MVRHEDLKISSSRSGLKIAITIFLPDHVSPRESNKPLPVIVMGHGIGAIKDGGLPSFASEFAARRYAAITFDYLHFGQSEGEPRNMLAVSGELQDFRDVVAWARHQPDRFDPDRVIVWGSSFGGMHTTALLAEDHQLAGGIAQCPCVDGFAASMMVPFGISARIFLAAMHDLLSSFFGGKPVYVALTADGSPSAPTAIMNGPEVIEGWKRITPEPSHLSFPNRITARSVFSILAHRPVSKVHKSVKPYLIILPTWDHQAPLAAAETAVRRAPWGKGVRVQGGHFDLYPGGPAYQENITSQLEFLERILV